MPLPRVSLRSFLSSAKSVLNAPHISPVTFVIGNESADSLCSAVVLAYLRTYSPTSKPSTLYIPLSNLPRADLYLRSELLPVLSRANLKPSDLITLSDLPPITSNQLLPENTRWILVDHNALQGELGRLFENYVIGCIDHHDEEDKVPKDCGDEPRIVRKSGSCSSLVVEYCKEAWDGLCRKSEPVNNDAASWNAQLAQLAIAPILVDTTNLTAATKTTETDIEAVRYLESFIPTHQHTREEYFIQISEAKEDIDGLSLPDILRKDYKQWTEDGLVKLGISSVVKDLQFLLQKAGDEETFLKIARDFVKEQDLSLYSIMTTSYPGGNFRRELLIWGVNETGSEAAKRFQESSKETLGLVPWNEGSLNIAEGVEWRSCWLQQRLDNSRKQVAPLLRTAILKKPSI